MPANLKFIAPEEKNLSVLPSANRTNSR